MEEFWREAKGMVGLFQLSNLGRLKTSSGRILKPSINDKGYVKYNVYGKIVSLHRILGMTFPDLVEWTENAKGKPFDEIFINHKDENPSNNSLDNLQWCTPKENCNWGTRSKRLCEKNGRRVRQYDRLGEFVAEYPSSNEAHRRTNIDQSSIAACCRGKQHSVGGYIWRWSDSLDDKRGDKIPQDACKIGNGKRVIQFTDTGEVVGVYDSAREAARQTGISNQAISILCRGSINGYKFAYLP